MINDHGTKEKMRKRKIYSLNRNACEKYLGLFVQSPTQRSSRNQSHHSWCCVLQNLVADENVGYKQSKYSH